jgi:hypothetical protein
MWDDVGGHTDMDPATRAANTTLNVTAKDDARRINEAELRSTRCTGAITSRHASRATTAPRNSDVG